MFVFKVLNSIAETFVAINIFVMAIVGVYVGATGKHFTNEWGTEQIDVTDFDQLGEYCSNQMSTDRLKDADGKINVLRAVIAPGEAMGNVLGAIYVNKHSS